MKHMRRVLIAVILFGVISYFILSFLFPIGVWRRRVLRENPLKVPTQITAIRGDTLISNGQEFRLAGVALPTDGSLSAEAADFLRVVTAQGVEVIRPIQPNGTLSFGASLAFGIGAATIQSRRTTSSST